MARRSLSVPDVHDILRSLSSNTDIRNCRHFSLRPEPSAAVSVTQLLRRIREGEAAAESELFPLVYNDLRDMASRLMRGERPGHTLQPTDLVHESFFKLVDGAAASAADRRHFLSIASRAMRQVLVSHARRSAADKRGGGIAHMRITNVDAGIDVDLAELVALDDALARLAELNPRLPKVIELRFFGGLSENETAEALDVTPRTIQRDWAMARAWLYKEMYGNDGAAE